MEAADSLMNLGRQFASGKITSEEYAAGVKNIQNELNASQGIFQKFGAAILGAKEMLLGIAAAAGVVAAAVGALKAAFDFAAEGAMLNRLADGFRNLGNSEADLDKLRKAALGTINDQNLMLEANRAQLLHVTDSTDELAKLMQVAAVRGRAMGISTTQAFGDIVTGIGRLSPKILDNIGIITEASTTYETYARSIGKTADQLTDAEKRQALVNKVIAEGAKLGPMLDDQASKFERLQAKLDNAGNSLKEFAADALTPVLQRSEDWGVLNDANATSLDKLAAAQRLNSDEMSGAAGLLNGRIIQLKEAAAAEEADRLALDAAKSAMASRALELAKQIGLSSGYLAAVNDEVKANEQMQTANNSAAEAMSRLNDVSRQHPEIVSKIIEADNALKKSFDDSALSIASMADKFSDLSKKQLDTALAEAAIGKLRDALSNGEIGSDEYAAAVKQISIEHGLATEKSYAMATGIETLTGLLIDRKINVDQYSEAINKVDTASQDGVVQMSELGLSVDEASVKMAGRSEVVDKYKTAVLEAGQSAAEASVATNDLKASIDRLKDKTITITTIFKTQGTAPDIPGGAPSAPVPSGQARGGIIAGAMGFIAQRPTYLVGEGGYNTFAGQGAEGVIPLNERGINILAEALGRALQRMPQTIINNTAMPGIDLVTTVSQGIAAQTRQAKRAGAGIMGR